MPAPALLAVDTETTGLDTAHDRVWEIGLATRGAGRICTVSALANPGVPLPTEIIKLCHISDTLRAQILLSPGIAEKLAKLRPRIAKHIHDGGLVVTYNGFAYDLPILNAECARYGLEPLPITATNHLDALVWMREGMSKVPGSKTLGNIALQLGIRTSGAHRAWADAATTLQVGEKLLAQLNRNGERSVEWLIDRQNLYRQLQDEDRAVFSFWLRRRNGVITVACGKNCGKRIEEVDRGFWAWVLKCHKQWENSVGAAPVDQDGRKPEPVPDAVLAIALERIRRG